MKLRFLLAATLATVTTSASVYAQQPWIKDRRYGEGIGIRAGNLELHPGIAAELGYDSNFFQRSENEDPGPISFYRLRITPHLTLSTLGPQRREAEGVGGAPSVTFSAGLFASYNELFNTDSNSDVNGSDYRHVDAGANFQLDVLPQRPWGFDLYGDYLRTIEPANTPDSDTGFDRDSMRLGAGVTWRPGGGLFDWRLGYEIAYHLFERSEFELFNNARHAIKTRNRWRFMPRTALLADAQYNFVRFSNDTTQNDGETLQARIGLNGLITHHFALLAMAGWAATFYDTASLNVPAQNYDGFIAHGELKWFLMPAPTLEATAATVGLSSIAAGYTRDFTTSYFGSFYVRDRGYLNFSYFIGGVAYIALEGGIARYSHPRTTFPSPPAPNDDVQRAPEFAEYRVDAQLFAEYRLSDIVGLNTTLRYNQNLADTQPLTAVSPAGVASAPEDLEFRRFEAYIGVRAFW